MTDAHDNQGSCIVFPVPFSSEKKITSGHAGKTIEEIILSQEIDKSCAPNLVASVVEAGTMILVDRPEKNAWSFRKLKEGQDLVISVIPKGGISDAFSSLSTSINNLSPTTKAFAQAGLSIGVGLLSGSRGKKFSEAQRREFSNAYSLQGSSNPRRIYDQNRKKLRKA